MAQITSHYNGVLRGGGSALILSFALALTPVTSFAQDAASDMAPSVQQAQRLAWRGDYAASLEMLDKLPDTPKTRAIRARVLAWAGFRHEALALNTPLWQAKPDDYYLSWTQALAESKSFWPHQALPPYEDARQAKPDSTDTRALALTVRLPLFSSVGLGYNHYSDSDNIRRDTVTADGQLRVTDRLELLGQVSHVRHRAPEGGPFAPITGGTTANENRGMLGARYALSPDTRFTLLAGASRVNGLSSEFIGQVAVDQQAADKFAWRFDLTRDRVNASPRSLGVMANTAGFTGQWRPNLRDTVTARLEGGHFDDGNNRYTLLPTWRHATYRSSKVMLDLGLTGELQHNSTNTNNGYYSPSSYRRLQPFASVYLNLGPEAGLYLSAATGIQRDETFSNWKQASDLGAELTLGIYTHWQLVARAAYSQRLNQQGEYHASTFGLQIRYRFCGFRSHRCPSIPSE